MSVQNNVEYENNDVLLKSRKHIEITGVVDVYGFDESSVSMKTTGGEMLIEGENLKIGTLDTERKIVCVDGKLNSVIYFDSSEPSKHSFFRKKNK